jgi:transposase
MRVIGLDVHRSFAQVAELKDGVLRQRGRLDLVRHKVLEFARTLGPDDEVVLEATGNTMAIVRLLKPHAGRVVIANPLQVRVIADAKVKTDRIDAAVLARLHAAGYLPEVWQPDEATEFLRRLVARRAGIVKGMTRTKNRIHAVLHANLIPPYQGKLFMAPGRKWLGEQPLAEDERAAVDRWLAALDGMEQELADAERALASACLGDERIGRLMTIGGINMPVAASVVSAIGDVSRFASAERLVSYPGLDPRVRQSGDKPAQHGRISKQGLAHARGMLVEAAWAAAATPGPLHPFFVRVQSRKGKQVAAVATARKIAVLAWHLLTKQEDYTWARPALVAMKQRQMQLKAGANSRRGGNAAGPTRDYSVKALRQQERSWVEQAEKAYTRFVTAWQERPRAKQKPATKSSANPATGGDVR